MVPHICVSPVHDQLLLHPDRLDFWTMQNQKPKSCNAKTVPKAKENEDVDCLTYRFKCWSVIAHFSHKDVYFRASIEEAGYNLSERIICQFWSQFTHLLASGDNKSQSIILTVQNSFGDDDYDNDADLYRIAQLSTKCSGLSKVNTIFFGDCAYILEAEYNLSVHKLPILVVVTVQRRNC